MNRRIFLAAGLILALLAACAPSPTVIPTPQVIVVTATSAPATSTNPQAPSATFTPIPTLSVPTFTSPAPTQPPGGMPPGINPGTVSGPYAVILVEPSDVLNIRSGPGADRTIIGTLGYDETGVTETGPWSSVSGSVWVEIQTSGGIRGWVNSKYLTEYVPPSTVCDTKVLTLLADFERAITNLDGELFATLVNSRHGLDVWAYRSGAPINFDPEHVRWVFESTYSHDWGDHPASGLEVTGPFHEAVLPNLTDMYDNGHEIHCGERGVAGWNISAWPEKYANINVYKIYKPGTPGVDLDYRIWLVGVEYVKGKPYLFSMIHFMWIP